MGDIMIGKKATKRVDLVLYVKINDFVDYAYKRLINLPKVAKYNACNDFLIKLFDSNILVSKLIKVSKNEKLEYCYKLQSNFKIMELILKYMVEERYIDICKYEKMDKCIDEICKLNYGYLKFLKEGFYGI